MDNLARKVKCEICGKLLKRIHWCHLKYHSITLTQYREMYPNADVGNFHIAGWNRGMKMNFNQKRAESISKALKGRNITWGDRISSVKQKQFEDKEFCAKMVANITRHASAVRPNIPEQKMMDLLNRLYPNEWKYVGNCGLVLGGLIPDFVNVNGKKLLIEVFGDYWHRNDNEQKRINHFKKFGYSTLIIWEHEIKKHISDVEQKVKAFSSVETITRVIPTG